MNQKPITATEVREREAAYWREQAEKPSKLKDAQAALLAPIVEKVRRILKAATH